MDLTFFFELLLNDEVEPRYAYRQLTGIEPCCSGMSSVGLMGEGAAIMAIVCRGGVVDWFCRKL